MNWLQKSLLSFALKSAGVLRLTDPQLARWFNTTTKSGRPVNDDTALQISAVFGCVRVLSETIGTLPWAIYQRSAEGNATRLDTHPMAALLMSPNSDMTKVEFLEAVISNLALRGNAYSLKEESAGRVVSLYPIKSSLVQTKINDDGQIRYLITDRGKQEEYPQEKIWHIKGFGVDGIQGLSPIGYARESMGISLAAEEFQARFFSQGAKPSFLAKIPQWLKEDQRKIARENLQTLWAGLENAHKIQLLEGGMDVTPLTMPLEDAQFLQLRGFSVEEICRIYRVPPHMVAKLDRSTNNNIEQQSLEFVMYTLAPYLTRIEASFSKWLLKAGERRDIFMRFNVEGLLRADATARANLYASGIQNGWLTRNEVRALENRNASADEGMNSFTVQSNMAPLDRLADIIAGRATATPDSSPSKSTEPVRIELAPFQESIDSVAQAVKAVSGSQAEMAGALLAIARSQKAVSDAAARMERAADQGAALMAGSANEMKQAIETLVELEKAPTEFIYDNNGEPIGNRKVS